MRTIATTVIWRGADTPVRAHELAVAGCAPAGYAYVRGVAQQAARVARGTRLARHERAQLLCAAWLSWLGPGATARCGDLAGVRALRRAGLEDLARIVAWAGGARALCAAADGTALAGEFRVPSGAAGRTLLLLDVALATTTCSGAPGSPAATLAELAARIGAGSLAVAAYVGLVADLSDHPQARELLAAVSPVALAGGA